MIREPDLFISSGMHDKESVDFLNTLFESAAQRCANDIHLLWNEGKLEIKLRLSGDLEPYDTADAQMAKLVDEKIRSRANMSAADRNTPLDGRMRLRFPDRTIDVRLSVIPVVGGQKMVCRILDQSNAAKKLDDIEMTPMVRRAIAEMIDEPQGLLVVVGPTGSGKTTTLYALIAALNNGKRNIVTLENPVEYVIPGISQVNIDQHVSFADGLRAALRQDPDVILVGEIRDHETAMIAVQAANTGHLVLTTLHANSASLAITRLIDMGVDPHSLAASLRGVMAQRLVRRLTSESAPEWREPTEADKVWLSKHNMQDVSTVYPSVEETSQFRGMVPVMEMIRADASVRKTILAQAGEMIILNAAARQSQFETLAQAGVRMSSGGYTTLGEVKKIVGEDAIAPQIKRVGDALVDMGVLSFEQVFAAIERQMELRAKGFVCKLGEILVDQGLCTTEQLVEALGFTAGAPAVLEPLVRSGSINQQDLSEAIGLWQSSLSGSSLFDICEARGIVSKEELNEPSIVYSPGSGGYLAAVAGAGPAGGRGTVQRSAAAV